MFIVNISRHHIGLRQCLICIKIRMSNALEDPMLPQYSDRASMPRAVCLKMLRWATEFVISYNCSYPE